MVEFTIRAFLLCFILFSTYEVSNGLGSSGFGRGRSAYKSEGQKQVYNGLGYANGDYQMKQSSGSKTVEASPRRGLGLSAWGLIGMMAGAVFLGTALYFAVLFYPILCKKERKNQNHRTLDCCPTTPSAPPASDNIPALSTPV